jgi:protein-S-isoprenylcysteine O-methyltransferase Ste14
MLRVEVYMGKRVMFFVYGCASYVVFLCTFLYAIAFVGGFIVPTRLDGDATTPLASALLGNLGLLTLFAVQHSVMARRWFKQWLTQFVPPVIERSTYVLCASLALLLLFWQWQPLGGVVWSVDDQASRALLFGLFGWGWAQVLVTTFLIDHFDLFGVRQVWLNLIGKSYTRPPFVMPAPYRVVRHPLYLGFLLAFWMTPTMTAAHLLFAVVTTAYIVVAIQLEERDLVHEHGSAYQEYRRHVPMLLPRARRAPDTASAVPNNATVRS